MAGGVFQVDREIFDHGIWEDIVKFRIFFYILGQAVFLDEGVVKAGIKIERGQYLRSLRKLQEDLAYREGRGGAVKTYPLTTLQNKIKTLVKDGQIKVKSTESGTLFTVVNYALYQGFERFKKGEVEQLSNSVRTATEQLPNNNKNVKKDKNDKNDNTSSRKRVYDEESAYFQLAARLFKNILVNDENFKKPNLQVWSDHIRLMMETDNRTEQQIAYLIDWVQQDSFWKSNILSTKKLREKSSQLIIRLQEKKGAGNNGPKTNQEPARQYEDGVNF